MTRLQQQAFIKHFIQQRDAYGDHPSRPVCIVAGFDMHDSTQLNSSSLRCAVPCRVVRKTYADMLVRHFTQLVSVNSCTFCKEARDIVGQVPIAKCEAQSVDGMYPSPGFLLRLLSSYPKQLPHTYAISSAYFSVVLHFAAEAGSPELTC